MQLKINDDNLFFDIYGSQLKLTKNSVCEKKSLIVLHGGHGFADHTLEAAQEMANLNILLMQVLLFIKTNLN